MAIGASTSGVSGTNDGQAYIYEVTGSTWNLDQTIPPYVNESSTRFGETIGITADASRLVVGDRRNSATVYDFGGSYGYVARLDPGSVSSGDVSISDDGLTITQITNVFGVDGTIHINELDGTWGTPQSFSPAHPDLATVWVGINDTHLRDGNLIIGCDKKHSGDGLPDGRGYVYIYSRDPIDP